MCRLILVALLLVPSVGFGEEALTLKVPAETRIKQGKLGKITVETTGKIVEWVALTPGLDFASCTPDGKTLTFTGLPGRYELLLYTAVGDVPSKPARTIVIIEGGDPAPDPIIPPAPSDQLKDKIRDAFAADKGEKADAIQLAALYREAAKLTMKKTDAKFDVPSSKELLRRVRESSAALIGGDVLPALRTVAASELATVFGIPSDEPLSLTQRTNASETFLKLALAIDALTP